MPFFIHERGTVSEDKNLFSLLEMIRVVGLRQVWETLLYARRSRLKDARFAKEPAPSGPWHKLGPLQAGFFPIRFPMRWLRRPGTPLILSSRRVRTVS